MVYSVNFQCCEATLVLQLNQNTEFIEQDHTTPIAKVNPPRGPVKRISNGL